MILREGTIFQPHVFEIRYLDTKLGTGQGEHRGGAEQRSIKEVAIYERVLNTPAVPTPNALATVAT